MKAEGGMFLLAISGTNIPLLAAFVIRFRLLSHVCYFIFITRLSLAK